LPRPKSGPSLAEHGNRANSRRSRSPLAMKPIERRYFTNDRYNTSLSCRSVSTGIDDDFRLSFLRRFSRRSVLASALIPDMLGPR
jgi:hypothetical protein